MVDILGIYSEYVNMNAIEYITNINQQWYLGHFGPVWKWRTSHDVIWIKETYVNMNEHDDQAVNFGIPNVYQPLYWNVWNTLEYTI